MMFLFYLTIKGTMMRHALNLISLSWDRYRVLLAAFLLFMSGALLSWMVAVVYFHFRLENQYTAFTNQIIHLTSDVDFERSINRKYLEDITDHLESNAQRVERAAETIEASK